MGQSFSRDPKKIQEYITRKKVNETRGEFAAIDEPNLLQDTSSPKTDHFNLLSNNQHTHQIVDEIQLETIHPVPQKIHVTPKLVEEISSLPTHHTHRLLNVISDYVQEVKILEVDDSSFEITTSNSHILESFNYCLQILTELELKKTLRQLYDVYSCGFIQQYEYETRKQEIEHQLLMDLSSKVPASSKPRTNMIRVFLSSTFRDMQKERDELVKYVFPKIKKICQDRDVVFSEVDLRWGITADQAESGQVLGLCLQEIDRCRPYFINILGSRYGYVPPRIPEDIRQRYKWLPNTDIEANHLSVTELEVMYGALNDPSEATRAFFYFRDGLDGPNEESIQDKHKVEALKSKIKNTKLPIKNYATPQELAEKIFDDLQRAIDVDFPKDSKRSISDIENYNNSMFADTKQRAYVPNEDLYQKLNNFLKDDASTPLVITGAPGSGKSSLLANWSAKPKPPNCHVITHFIGCSSLSSNYLSLIVRVLTLLKQKYEIEDEIPSERHKILQSFSRWIACYVPKHQKLILILDGLDHLDNKDDSLSLLWLPEQLATLKNLKLIVSTSTDSRACIALQNRNWRIMRVPLLELHEREAISCDYFALYGKNLDHHQLTRISNAPETRNGLYLKILLEELRVHGVYEEINHKIDYYLTSTSISSLFDKVLQRLENDFEARTPMLVSNFMSYLWASKCGLTEKEVMSLMKLSQFAFSQFYSSVQEFVTDRGGYLTIAQEDLRQAIERRYLPTELQKNQYRKKLVEFFWTADDSRKSDEIPYLLSESKNYDDLKKALTNIPIFLMLYTKLRKNELKGYWMQLKQVDPQVDLAGSYQSSLNSFKATANTTSVEEAFRKSARFLREMVCYDTSESIYQEALRLCVQLNGEISLPVGKMYYLIAELYWNQSKWDQAEPACIKSLQIREKLLGSAHPTVAKTLIGLGEMEMRKPNGNNTAADIIKKALKIAMEHWGSEHLVVARCLQDLSIIYDTAGNSDKAIEYCEKALIITEKLLGSSDPQVANCLETLGSIYAMSGQSYKGEPVMRRALKINQAIHGDLHPSTATCCGWLSIILKDLNQLEEAQQFHRKSKEIQKHIGECSERISD